jgi:hypothetical protein
LSDNTFGIERYVEIAKGITATGNNGANGRLGIGIPTILGGRDESSSVSETPATIITIGTTATVREYTFERNWLKDSDIIIIELWFTPNIDADGAYTPTKLYWNDILVKSITPLEIAAVENYTITRVWLSKIRPNEMHITQSAQRNYVRSSSVSIGYDWILSGGTLKLTAGPSKEIIYINCRMMIISGE